MRPANGRLGEIAEVQPRQDLCRQLLPRVRRRQVALGVGQQFVDQALGQRLGVVDQDELRALLRLALRDEADGRHRELGKVGVADRGAALLAVDQPGWLLIVGQ